MRVRIDATPLLLRSAGVKNYLYYWAQHMRRVPHSGELDLFPFIGELPGLTHEASILSRAATLPRVALSLLARDVDGVLDYFSKDTDVFHVSNIVRRRPKNVKVTATVHDMTCWLMPELHTPANVRADEAFAESVLKRADGLIAVSDQTRRDVIEYLGINPDKIRVIYSGVTENFFTVTPQDTTKVREKYRLERPYLLSLGTVEPRKNLDATLSAYRLIPRDLRETCELVLAGPIGWARQETVSKLRSPLSDIRYLGYVPEQDLPGLTAGAAAFVYPSLYEGFGFPVAQAMATGVPVVTSNVSCLPEVVGDGGLLIDPRSLAELASAFVRIMSSADLRAELGAAGRLRAQRYRWAKCAEESWQFFREVAGT